jgi:hypothetical protein
MKGSLYSLSFTPREKPTQRNKTHIDVTSAHHQGTISLDPETTQLELVLDQTRITNTQERTAIVAVTSARPVTTLPMPAALHSTAGDGTVVAAQRNTHSCAHSARGHDFWVSAFCVSGMGEG